jgi:hypothetical protein
VLVPLELGEGLGLGLALGEGLGLGLGDAEAEAEAEGCGLAPGWQLVDADGPGLAPGRQLGDGDGRRVPDPDTEPVWDGDADGELPALPPEPVGPLFGCEFELLGDTAVEMSIATYEPAATMKITIAIAASGRSQLSLLVRCLPRAVGGA